MSIFLSPAFRTKDNVDFKLALVVSLLRYYDLSIRSHSWLLSLYFEEPLSFDLSLFFWSFSSYLGFKLISLSLVFSLERGNSR